MDEGSNHMALEQKVRNLQKEVSKLEKIEKALAESEARYKGIVENTVNGVVVYKADKNGEDFIIIDFNKGAEKIENVQAMDVIGKSVVDVFPGVKKFGLFNVFQKVWQTGKPEHFPLSIYKDERISGWRDNFIYKLPSGEIVAVYSDETERKKAEEALKIAHEKLYNFSQALEKKVQERTEELERKNKELVEAEKLAVLGTMANRVAHEIRNPLMIIGGFIRRLNKNTPDDDPSKKYLKIILDEVVVLEDKVSQIIKIEKGS